MNREIYVDQVKGLAIISVVLGHIVYAYPSLSFLPLRNMLTYFWHVPVFFVVAGFFLKDDELRQPKVFIKKKCRSLYKLILYFYVPAVLLHNLFFKIGVYSPNLDYVGKHIHEWSWGENIKELLLSICLAGREPIVGPMWFVCVLMLALCGLSIVSYMVGNIQCRKWSYENKLFVVLLSLAIISHLLTNKIGFNIPRFNNTIVAMFLIYLGWMLKQKYKLSFDNNVVAIVCALICYNLVLTLGGVDMNSNRFHDVLTLSCSAVGVTYLLCFMFKKAECLGFASWLAYVGKDSFYIMALQFAGFKLGMVILNVAAGKDYDIAELLPHAENVYELLFFLFVGVALPLFFMFVLRVLTKFLSCRANEIY